MGLTPISLRAETGPIGGNLSHEFQILASTGESTLYYDKELETINPDTIDPEKLQSFYAAVDDQHDEKNCPITKENIKVSKGIEVGHIFYFGDKYSKPLKCSVDLQDGKKVDVKMGSYDIGVSRLVGAIIEAKFNNNIMKWPQSVAPFEAAIIPLAHFVVQLEVHAPRVPCQGSTWRTRLEERMPCQIINVVPFAEFTVARSRYRCSAAGINSIQGWYAFFN